MNWTDYFPEFKQTMFEFEDNELAHADELVKAVCKMLMEKTSSPYTAIAIFVLLIADFIASNVNQEEWDEALTAVGSLAKAALMRLGLEHGLIEIAPNHLQ